jgi:hypothetical protein
VVEAVGEQAEERVQTIQPVQVQRQEPVVRQAASVAIQLLELLDRERQAVKPLLLMGLRLLGALKEQHTEQLVKMNKKYQVWCQVSGVYELASTFEEAKVLQQLVMDRYWKTVKHCFDISVITENADGTFSQAKADENGNPDTIEEYLTQVLPNDNS